jgi:hypothetical protein
VRQWLAVITGTPPRINFKHVGDPNLTPPRVPFCQNAGGEPAYE